MRTIYSYKFSFTKKLLLKEDTRFNGRMGWYALSKINQFISNEAFLFFIFQMCFKTGAQFLFFYPDWRNMVVVSLFTVLDARLINSHHSLLSSRDKFLILLQLYIICLWIKCYKKIVVFQLIYIYYIYKWAKRFIV